MPKKITSIILVMAILVTSLIFNYSFVYASPHSHYEDCTQIPEFYNSGDNAAIEYWNQIKNSLPQGTTPTISKSGSIFPLNFRLWHDKGLVVYGSYRICNTGKNDWKPATQPGGPTAPALNNQGYYFNNGSRGEYRYHGFSANGDRFTNIDFPADAYLGKEASKDWIIAPWYSSKVVPVISQSPYSYSANDRNNTTTQNWINRAINFSIHDEISQAHKYLHIQQAPTTNYPGQGRMWHIHNNSLWYQSFPIPKMDASTKIAAKTSDIEVTLTVNNPLSDFEFIDYKDKSDNDIITVNVTVTAKLLDDSYYNDAANKVNHYTRDDIKSWTITLNGESKTVARWSENSAKAVFEIPLKKSQIKGLSSHRLLLSAKGKALFHDNSASPEKQASGNVQFTIDNAPTPPSPPEPIIPFDPDAQPIDFEPAPIVPEYAFDIIKFSASDNSDMSTVDTREVYVDGEKINDVEFFSGNYIFGEECSGLKQVVINYTSIDGQKIQFIKWVVVYSTKPKAQFKLEGTYKQMRKLFVTNTSLLANDELVLENFPITSYQWEFGTISGEAGSLKTRNGGTDVYKEFLYKKPGTYQITLRAVNTLGRVSEPYILQYFIAPDVPPAIEICLDNSVLGRNEAISAYHYHVSSTDGDIIKSNTIELWYDSNNDGIYNQLLNTFNGSNGFPSYTPTKLGRYKFINRVEEDYGQDTLQEFVTPSDKVYKVQEVEFLVDNYIPMTDIYIDIPIIRPQIDVFIMNDANLNSSKNSYILTNRMNFDNFLRSRNILPQVRTWDMRTYTYSESAYTTIHSGSSYPPSSTWYSSGGYSGTLYRTSVSDNGYYHDYGKYETVTDSKTVTINWYNTVTSRGYYDPYEIYDIHESNPAYGAQSIPYSHDGYTGTLDRLSTTVVYDSGYQSDGVDPATGRNKWKIERTFHAVFSGTVSKQITVWVPDWRWVNDYTGHYSGTIYNYVRQPYVDPFRATSKKYVIYVSDSSISELYDLASVMSKADARLILIGSQSIRTQIEHEHFILNNKPIDQLMNEAMAYIAESSPAVQKYFVLAGQDTFTMNTANFDEEGDPITEEKFLYVQNPYYFDNPTGMESYSVAAFSENTGWTDLKANTFNKTGEFHIYRRIKDRPTTNPNFAQYSYYSGTPQIIIYSHRKPVAMAQLSWDYNSSDNMYQTTWVDLSYDPDHQYSRADKGIVERKVMYRRFGGEWIYKVPDKLPHGSYELHYYVKDPEGVWSDPFILNFNLNSIPPMQFEASARTLDSRFSLSSIPASEFLEAYNLWTRFPYNVYLQLGLYSGANLVAPVKTVYFNGSTGVKSGNDINWSNVQYQLPDTLSDGTYILRASAVGDYGQSAHKNFSVTVNTPINLVGYINNAASNAEIQADAMNSFTFTTSRYVSSVRLIFKGQTYTSSSGAIILISSSGSSKTWELNLNVASNTVVDNETGYAAFTAWTPSGKSETVNVNYKILTIQAYDFTITSIQDIKWRGYYFDLANPINGDGEKYGYPKRLNTDIKTTQMPVNSLGLIPYAQSSVSAGYRIKGYIRIKGNPDSANLVARYTSNSVLKTAEVALSYAGGDKYTFDWIIPQDTDTNSYVGFDVVIRNGAITYGNEKWIDTWEQGNSSRWVLMVRGTVLDDIIYNQSN